MSDSRHSRGTIAAFAFGALGTLAFFGGILHSQPTLASAAAEDKKSVEVPRFTGRDAIEHFQLQPFNISVIRDGRVERILSLVVTLETKGDVNKMKIITERHHLQDAFLRDMHAISSFRRSDGQVFDAELFKARLMVISDRILGEDIVENILLQNIFDRRNP